MTKWDKIALTFRNSLVIITLFTLAELSVRDFFIPPMRIIRIMKNTVLTNISIISLYLAMFIMSSLVGKICFQLVKPMLNINKEK